MHLNCRQWAQRMGTDFDANMFQHSIFRCKEHHLCFLIINFQHISLQPIAHVCHTFLHTSKHRVYFSITVGFKRKVVLRLISIRVVLQSMFSDDTSSLV